MPDLSAIIINWNTADLLARCLAALAADAPGLDCQIIVVDNGSTDGSPASVRASFPAVHLIENDANRGYARAANQGIRAATGRAILLLNSDAILRPGAIAALRAALDADATVGIVGARLFNDDGSPQNSVANTPCLLTEIGKKSLLKRLFPHRFYSRTFLPAGPTAVESLVGACVMVRRDMIDRIGPLDEDYFFFIEETDWCLRARQAGWRVVFQPKAEVVHLQGRSAARAWWNARIEYWRSRYLFFRKHRGPAARAALALGLQLELWVDIFYFALLSPFSAKYRGRLAGSIIILLWHLRGLPADWGLPRARLSPGLGSPSPAADASR